MLRRRVREWAGLLLRQRVLVGITTSARWKTTRGFDVPRRVKVVIAVLLHPQYTLQENPLAIPSLPVVSDPGLRDVGSVQKSTEVFIPGTCAQHSVQK